jgi:hypothetical protein
LAASVILTIRNAAALWRFRANRYPLRWKKQGAGMSRWRAPFTILAILMAGQTCAAEDFLGGAKLYADVARYAAFGTHRFGSPGDRATTDWIAGELQAAGFDVAFQPVVLGRQYVVDRATAEADGTTVEATPFWWPP